MRKSLLILVLIFGMAGLARAQQKQVLSAAATTCTASNASCLVTGIDQTQGGTTFTISANASGNTIQFEASGDGGTTWVALSVTPSNSTTTVTSTTSTGTWQANIAGYTNIRMRMSTLAGGTTTVSAIQSTASARSGGGGGGGTVSGSGASSQVAFWASPSVLTGDPGLTYTPTPTPFLFTGPPNSGFSANIQGLISGLGGPIGFQSNRHITVGSPDNQTLGMLQVFQDDNDDSSDGFIGITDMTNLPTGADTAGGFEIYVNVPTGITNPNFQAAENSEAVFYGLGTTFEMDAHDGFVANESTGTIDTSVVFGAIAVHNEGGGTVHNSFGFKADDMNTGNDGTNGDTLISGYYAGPQTQTISPHVWGFYSASSNQDHFGSLFDSLNNTASSAVSAPISVVQDTNAALGPNTAETFGHWSSINETNGTNCGGASAANGWNWYKYGDGSGGLQESCNGKVQAGWHLDVGSASSAAPSGRFEAYGGLSGVFANEYGDKGFSTSQAPGTANPAQSAILMDRTNAIAPNFGEVSYTSNGLLQAYAGAALPASSPSIPDVNIGQGIIVAAGHVNLLAAGVTITTIYNTNGAMAVSSATCASNVSTVTLLHNVPTAWVNNSYVNVVAESGTGAANGNLLPITVTGATTFTYPLACTNGSATVTSAYIVPSYGQLAGANLTQTAGIDTWTGAGGTITSGSCSSGTVTLNLNLVTGASFTGHVIDISGLTGNCGTLANGTYPISASSGIGASGTQYVCVGCGANTVVTTTAGIVTTRRYIGGNGRYIFSGVADGITSATAGATLTMTLTCPDEAGTVASPTAVSTAAMPFGVVKTPQPFSLELACTDGGPVQYTAAFTGTPPTISSLDYTLEYK